MNMKIAQVRYLRKGEQEPIPKYLNAFPRRLKDWYLLTKKPYQLVETDAFLSVAMSTYAGNGLDTHWREAMTGMLELLRDEQEVGVVVAPTDGEFVEDVLPIARGNQLTGLFAFEAAAEALKRQGKNPQGAKYLIVGGDLSKLRQVIGGIGDFVNHLTVFSASPKDLASIVEELFFERGLVVEVFSSPKNPAFAEADVVISCGNEQLAYEYLLKENSIWLTTNNERGLLHKIQNRREDITALNGVYLCKEKRSQFQSDLAEAMLYIAYPEFRLFWQKDARIDAEKLFLRLKEDGFFVTGFSALGKRVKIASKQG